MTQNENLVSMMSLFIYMCEWFIVYWCVQFVAVKCKRWHIYTNAFASDPLYVWSVEEVHKSTEHSTILDIT